MDKRLFGVWRRTVRLDDTMICLGDVVFSGINRFEARASESGDTWTERLRW